jgi:YHS domain-containing protein
MTAQRQERKAWHRAIAVIAMLAGCTVPGGGEFAARAATTERVVVNRISGLAISGFDPVAYFSESEPKQGLPDFELSRGGAVWRFCSAANMAFFKARPDIYAPQFGGYDPVDVARGVVVAGNSWIWLVINQRLFLFSREESRDAFAADPASFVNAAVHRWPELRESLAE